MKRQNWMVARIHKSDSLLKTHLLKRLLRLCGIRSAGAKSACRQGTIAIATDARRLSGAFWHLVQSVELQQFPFPVDAPDEWSRSTSGRFLGCVAAVVACYRRAGQHSTVTVDRLGAVQDHHAFCRTQLSLQIVLLANLVLQVGNLRLQPGPPRGDTRSVLSVPPCCSLRSENMKINQFYRL